MQSIPSSKGVCYQSASVSSKDGHMYQVPSPLRPTTTCHSSVSIYHYSKLLKCGDSKTILSCSSLGFFRHWSTASSPKILVTVESYSYLCCLCSRLIITNHYGSSDIRQLAVGPDSDVENFKVLLYRIRHDLHKTI